MKRTISFGAGLAIFVVGGVLGTAVGVALGLFFFPFIFPPPTAMEQLTDADRSALVATGNFIQADPSDRIHYGSGRVGIYEKAVFLDEDFEVGPGPKYHVYLVPKASIRHSDDVKDAMYIDLGQLRSFKGSQRYPIPGGIDLGQYPSVVIWCEAFSVLISPADLKFADL